MMRGRKLGGRFSVSTPLQGRLDRSLRAEVEIIADRPEETLLWSDIVDLLRLGYASLRRLVSSDRPRVAH